MFQAIPEGLQSLNLLNAESLPLRAEFVVVDGNRALINLAATTQCTYF